MRGDSQRAVDGTNTLFHANHPPVAARRQKRIRGVEPMAVVGHRQPNGRIHVCEFHTDTAAARMPGGVRDRLLRNPQKLLINPARQAAGRTDNLDIERHARSTGQLRGDLLNRGRQILFVENRRTEIPQRLTAFTHVPLDLPAQL